MTQDHLDQLSYKIIGSAINVHKELGPGLLESIYQSCMLHDLKLKNMEVIQQLSIPISYKGLALKALLRLDLLVEKEIIVELKSVESLLPIHEAQLLTYMKLLKKSKGILINFNCTNLYKFGQKTLVTKEYYNLPQF